MANKEKEVMIQELKQYAEENKVPIMQEEGIRFLTNFIQEHKISSVLEVGTAIGYSAIMMALANPSLTVVSIERDESRYQEAVENVKKFGLEKRIKLMLQEALEVELEEKFDLIFLDGAKGKNIDFLEHFEKNLESDGTIITDNMDFHGYVSQEISDIPSRNLRGLVRKIKKYIEYLENSSVYETKIYHIGDGIAVTSRKRN